MSSRVAIVGIGETAGKRRRPEISQVELVNEAARAALADAQLSIKDIDAVITGNMEFFEGAAFPDQWLVEGSGGYLKSGMRVNAAGDTGATCFITGVAQVASGIFNKVLCIGFEKQDEGAYGGIGMRSEDSFFNIAGGSGRAIGGMWSMAIDLLHNRKSCTEEHVAKLRVKEAECGRRNPYAHLKLNITTQDVLNSEVVIAPLRFLHICSTSVSSCAVVLASKSEAQKISNKPVWIKDYECVHGGMQPRMGEPWLCAGLVYPTGPQWKWGVEQATIRLYKRLGITNPRKQIDAIETYSPSTWHEVDSYELLRLCEKGQAWRLIEAEATWPNGDIPVDASGGVMSTNAIGATGLHRIANAALQIRGDAGTRQVTRKVNQALAYAMGADQFGTVIILNKSL
jgi:acetyl-CoA C-acetyltransferase